MKKLLWAVTGFLFWITCACSESEIGYTPIGKEHLGQNYVEVQYGQNAMWYTINGQRHSGEYLLRANDGMAVRIIMRANGRSINEDGEIKYEAGVTINDFRIEEAND